MARRGRDLFELLRERSGGSGKSGSSSSRGSPRTSAASSRSGNPGPGKSGGGILSRLGETARALVGGSGSAQAPRRTAAPPKTSASARGLPSGTGVVGLVLIALLLGFVLGRFTAPATSTTGSSKQGSVPARIPEYQGTSTVSGERSPRQAPALTEEQQEEQLSTLGWFLLQCPARDRARAAECAAWFRDSGLARTRIRRLMTRSAPGEFEYWYLVICYTTPQDQAQDLNTIRALDLPTRFDDPSTEGGLFRVASAVKGMRDVPRDLKSLSENK